MNNLKTSELDERDIKRYLKEVCEVSGYIHKLKLQTGISRLGASTIMRKQMFEEYLDWEGEGWSLKHSARRAYRLLSIDS